MSTDLELPSEKYPSLGGVVRVLLWTILLYLLASLLGEFSFQKWSILAGELALLLPAYVYLRRHKFRASTVFRLRAVSGRVVAMSFILGLAITALSIELDRLVSLVLPFPEILAETLRQTLKAESWTDWIFILLAAVIFAGALEEMLFRGFVQNAFEQRHNPLFAIFITAILFGFVHLSPWWIVQLIFIAMFLGILAWKSDSIVPSAIVHAQNNFIAVLLSNSSSERGNALLDWNGHLHPLLLLAALLIVALGLRLFFRFCEEDIQIPTFLNTPLSAAER
ncbi:MAG: lysostaphin resistance A-like protein [bacterium]